MKGFIRLKYSIKHISINQILAWIPVLLIMGTIFYLSHQPASDSSKLSGSVTELIAQMITAIPILQIDMDKFHFFIRKSAHFLAYLTLGFFVMNAVQISFRKAIFKLIRYRISFALLVCILYAISDEVHQLFIPGRSGEVGDVLIDSAGDFVGIGIYHFVIRKIKNRK